MYAHDLQCIHLILHTRLAFSGKKLKSLGGELPSSTAINHHIAYKQASCCQRDFRRRVAGSEEKGKEGEKERVPRRTTNDPPDPSYPDSIGSRSKALPAL
eukprot:scaffold162742_cov21-Tisochrysis_lutea.AAC.1